MKNKKLQVFVSSTYTDLLKERQAAVEAILTCGHIPAGMELFTAGDETQMTVIKRWIEESDVYLLILGGRYGSIDPKSKKSYTQLEYEYALELEKPYFTVVIKEKALKSKVEKFGIKMQEIDKPKKLAAFRKKVTSGVIVEFFDDKKDIKLAIYKALSEFKERKETTGWVKNENQINITQLTNEVTQLSEENAELRKQLSKQTTYDNGLNFDQIYQLLLDNTLNSNSFEFEDYKKKIKNILLGYQFDEFNCLAYFILFADYFYNGFSDHSTISAVPLLIKLGLVQIKKPSINSTYYMTEDGRNFHLQLETKRLKQSN